MKSWKTTVAPRTARLAPLQWSHDYEVVENLGMSRQNYSQLETLQWSHDYEVVENH